MAKVAAFGDIGKVASDLINKGYDFKNTFTLNAAAGDGTKMTLKAVKDADKLSGDIKLAKAISSANVDVTITSGSKVSVNSSLSNLYPGLKCTLAGSLPDHTSGKLTLDYSAPHVTTKTVVGLTSNPTINFSGSTGTKSGIIGTDLVFDTAKSAISKWSVGAAYLGDEYSAGLVLADKGETLKATYAHTIDKSQTAGCEVVRKLNADSTTFTMGYQKKLDTGASVKMRIANSGIGAMSYTFSPAAQSVLTLSGQFDTTAPEKNTKLGMSLDVKA